MSAQSVLPSHCCAPGAPALDPVQAAALAARFKALGDPTRVALVNRLAGCEEVCVCDLTEATSLSQPTVSHHLKKLRDAGLVEVERRGTLSYYRLAPGALAELAEALVPQR